MKSKILITLPKREIVLQLECETDVERAFINAAHNVGAELKAEITQYCNEEPSVLLLVREI